LSLWCPLYKQQMTQVCDRSLAGGTDIKRLMTSSVTMMSYPL